MNSIRKMGMAELIARFLIIAGTAAAFSAAAL